MRFHPKYNRYMNASLISCFEQFCSISFFYYFLTRYQVSSLNRWELNILNNKHIFVYARCLIVPLKRSRKSAKMDQIFEIYDFFGTFSSWVNLIFWAWKIFSQSLLLEMRNTIRGISCKILQKNTMKEFFLKFLSILDFN